MPLFRNEKEQPTSIRCEWLCRGGGGGSANPTEAAQLRGIGSGFWRSTSVSYYRCAIFYDKVILRVDTLF